MHSHYLHGSSSHYLLTSSLVSICLLITNPSDSCEMWHQVLGMFYYISRPPGQCNTFHLTSTFNEKKKMNFCPFVMIKRSGCLQICCNALRMSMYMCFTSKYGIESMLNNSVFTAYFDFLFDVVYWTWFRLHSSIRQRLQYMLCSSVEYLFLWENIYMPHL